MASLFAFFLVILLKCDCLYGDSAKNATNSTEILGGSVKIEFLSNIAANSKAILFTKNNSTIFTDSAPIPPSDGIWGELVPFSPIDACGPLQLSNYTQKIGNSVHFAPIGPYPHIIALVARGNCSFEEKFDYVDDVPNVIGMLIYDYPNGGNLSSDIELSSFKPLNIPGFLIDYEHGMELKQKADQMRLEARSDGKKDKRPLWIKVTLAYVPDIGAIENVLQYVLLFVMLLLCGAFLASVYMHWHIYRMQRRLDENRQTAARNAIIIDDAFLEKLPVRSFRRTGTPISIDLNDGAGVSKLSRMSPKVIAPVELEEGMIHAHAPPNDTCPICLDEFGQYESLNELFCGHFYHISCIRPWLQHRSPCCPMCKEDVRDAFVTLSPLEEEKSLPQIFINSIKRWLCCGRCKKQQPPPPQSSPEQQQHDHSAVNQQSIMTEVRIPALTSDIVDTNHNSINNDSNSDDSGNENKNSNDNGINNNHGDSSDRGQRETLHQVSSSYYNEAKR